MALFVRSTDIIDFKKMEEVIAQLNGPEAETSNWIAFSPRRAYNMEHEEDWLMLDRSEYKHKPVSTCKTKVLMRCDHISDFSDMIDDAWEEVKYARDLEGITKLFTGIIRVQSGIQEVSVNGVLNAVITLPWEEVPTAAIKQWVEDLKPPALMDHELPKKYLRSLADKPANQTDLYALARTDLIRTVPECIGPSPLVLITSARTNFRKRQAHRIYFEAMDIGATVRYLIGHSSPKEAKNDTIQLDAEIAMHNDFIIGGYEDTYQNLPMKVS